MTLKVKIENKGNNPEDHTMIRGLELYDGKSEDGDTLAFFSSDPNKSVTLLPGEAVIVIPPCGHYDDFATLQLKGKH